MAVSVDVAERERLPPQAPDLVEFEEEETAQPRRSAPPTVVPTTGSEPDVAALQPMLGNGALARVLAPPEQPTAPAAATVPSTPEPVEQPPPEAPMGPEEPTTGKAAADAQPPPEAEGDARPPAAATAAPEKPGPEEPKEAAAAAAAPAAVQPPASVSAAAAPAAPGAEATTAAAAAPVAFAADSTPGDIIHGLADTAPTAAAAALAQAQAASAPALERQRAAAADAVPELPAPTGQPAAVAPRPETTPPPQVGAPPDLAPAEGASVQTTPTSDVPEAPPVATRPTVLAGGGGSADQPAADQVLSESAQTELNAVDLPGDAVPTTLGERPTVDTAADTAGLATQETQAHDFVGGEATKTAAAANQDFGENAIYPRPDNETLRAQTEVKGRPAAPGGAPAGPLALSADVAAGLDVSLKPVLAERLGAKAAEYDAGDDRYQADANAAQEKARSDIGDLETQAATQQTAEQQKAKTEVAQQRTQWRREVDDVQKDFSKKSAAERQSHEQKVGDEKRKGEADAAAAYKKAESDVAKGKADSEAKAAAKKKEAEKKSSGFWGWVKSKAKALIDALKDALNFIYDNLRKLVKAAFEFAKKVAHLAIDLARKAINRLIKAFGAVLKTFVSIALAAFPEIAARINAKIDKVVDKAVDAVNAAADWLKKSVDAVLDFLASTIDSILGLIQSIYNGILTVVGMIVSGEFVELMRRLGYLVDAAKTVPDVFEQAALEELLGTNLDEPLSPAELAQAGKSPPGADGGTAGPAAGPLPTAPWTPQNVGVDEIDTNHELSPELSQDVLEQTGGSGTVEFGTSTDPSRTMEAVVAEAGGAHTGEDVAAQKLPDDGLTPVERAKVRWELMKTGIAKWWSDNWGKILLGAAAAILGFIALNIVTGGAITAALGAIMGVVGPLFVGLTVLKLAGYVKDYVSQAWNGNIRAGGKSLAKGLAAGAIELISWLTFKAAGAAMKGAKALAKGVVRLAQKAASAIAKGFKFIVEKGKVLFQGLARAAGKGLGKAVKKLSDLGEKLLEKLRFRKFRIVVHGRRFAIEGWINPWVVIMEGPLKGDILEVSESQVKTSNLLKGQTGTLVRSGKEDLKVMLVSVKKAFPRDEYREIHRLFTGISPKQLRKIVVHHVIERQTKKLFGVFKDQFLNAPRRLIAIEKGTINRIVHLSEIRVMWNRMYPLLEGLGDRAVAAGLTKFASYTERFLAHMENAIMELRAAGKPITEKALRDAAKAFKAAESVDDALRTAEAAAKQLKSVP